MSGRTSSMPLVPSLKRTHVLSKINIYSSRYSEEALLLAINACFPHSLASLLHQLWFKILYFFYALNLQVRSYGLQAHFFA